MSSVHDQHFRGFAKSLTRLIGERRADTPEQRTARQRSQIEGLVAAEERWRDALLAHPDGNAALNDFLDFILVRKKNILSARPYFRERQVVFAGTISAALRHRDIDTIMKCRVNWQFIRQVMLSREWDKDDSQALLAAYEDVKRIRNSLMEENLPLCINRALQFWRKTPRSHLDYMDLVQIATEGLANAIDKFVPPFRTVFRSVAIGRMVGNFIQEYSEPMLHFYPSDKRVIYRANKAARRMESPDYAEIAERVNDGLDIKTTPDEIHRLTSAASHISSDFMPAAGADKDSGATEALQTAAPDSWRPDVALEEADSWRALQASARSLTSIERKLIRMKGVHLE